MGQVPASAPAHEQETEDESEEGDDLIAGWKCDLCNFETTHRCRWNRHINQVGHKRKMGMPKPVKEYQCPDCDYKTTDRSNMHNHKKRHANQIKYRYYCEICDVYIEHEQNMIRHRETAQHKQMIREKHPEWIFPSTVKGPDKIDQRSGQVIKERRTTRPRVADPPAKRPRTERPRSEPAPVPDTDPEPAPEPVLEPVQIQPVDAQQNADPKVLSDDSVLVLCRTHSRIWKRMNIGCVDADIEKVQKICKVSKRTKMDILFLRDWLRKNHPDAFQDSSDGDE